MLELSNINEQHDNILSLFRSFSITKDLGFESSNSINYREEFSIFCDLSLASTGLLLAVQWMGFSELGKNTSFNEHPVRKTSKSRYYTLNTYIFQMIFAHSKASAPIEAGK